jgi:hypothetical protein
VGVKTRAALILEVKDELGTDIAATFTDDEEYGRYLNQGQDRLGFYDEKTATLTWTSGDASEAFPSDYAKIDRIVPARGTTMPQHKAWGATLRFTDPDGAASDGEATLYYYASWPEITGAVSSSLPPVGDTAIVAFAAYRFLRRLATSRADYERYSTLVSSNGVDIAELRDLAQDHYDEFDDARQTLHAEEPVSYYGD